MTFDLSAVTVVAWQSKTGDSIHLGVAGSPPRCAGRDPTPVAETRKFAVHRDDEWPAVAEALNRLNVALGLSELASRVESKRLCRRCSARYITQPNTRKRPRVVRLSAGDAVGGRVRVAGGA
jgi:hypothetical protein